MTIKLTDAEVTRGTVQFIRFATADDSVQAITALANAMLAVVDLATLSPVGVVAVLDALLKPLQAARDLAASRIPQPAVTS